MLASLTISHWRTHYIKRRSILPKHASYNSDTVSVPLGPSNKTEVFTIDLFIISSFFNSIVEY